MKVFVAKETESGERRVALVPDTIPRVRKLGLEVTVECGAGERAFFSDEAYREAGARLTADREAAIAAADIFLKVGPPRDEEMEVMHPGQTVVSFLNPLGRPELIRRLAQKGVTAFSMELIPRSSRAQGMDALSSQASIAGYKAVLLGAAALPKYLPMLTTAAGTIPPAKVLVLGAGVAGLQAIATARRLGALVEAYDIRPAVKEEVESLGAKFIEVPITEETTAAGGYARPVSEEANQRAREVLTSHVRDADIAITTAQVPGRQAPILITNEMVKQMRPGSVIVDLATEQGGNCEGSVAGKEVVLYGVTILGPLNLPSSMPVHASQKYARNLFHLLKHLVNGGNLHLDFSDDITHNTCITYAGEIRNARVKEALSRLTAVAA